MPLIAYAMMIVSVAAIAVYAWIVRPRWKAKDVGDGYQES